MTVDKLSQQIEFDGLCRLSDMASRRVRRYVEFACEAEGATGNRKQKVRDHGHDNAFDLIG